ncbi:Brefeldin A-inhibited guanine nucleotide-exchange protein 5 [Apostasia shenzhenica]|uniref:Brefeldin A-inhibited guanine nucleotide-exchange protein 5 n=1 Tax=Apostasia shenzhenica TaxID=1088818 RepID=A0A2I0BCA9_9ASPA|nr:Brefeldin A-inhibited guanine nucleotide-exchange protein 5 [Apostasia shenzhenica]
MENQDEGRVTLEDPLSNQEKGSSPTIVEVLQNPAGGADIKKTLLVVPARVVDKSGSKSGSCLSMGMKEENDDVTTKSRLLSLELLQCLVSVLKSLVDWEKLRGASGNPDSIVQSLEEDVLGQEPSDEPKIREDGPNQFEKAKVHKSTMEAAIAEVAKDHFDSFNIELSNAMIREYLGQHDGFPLAVMHAYVDSMNFWV